MKVALGLATALLAIGSAIGKTTKYKYSQESTLVSFSGSSRNGCGFNKLDLFAYNNVVEDNDQEKVINMTYVQTYGINRCNGPYVYDIWALCDIGDGLTANPKEGAVLDFEIKCSPSGYVNDQPFSEIISISLHATLTPTEPVVKFNNRDHRIQAGGMVIQSMSRGSEVSAEGDCTGSIGEFSDLNFDIIDGYITKYDSGKFTINK